MLWFAVSRNVKGHHGLICKQAENRLYMMRHIRHFLFALTHSAWHKELRQLLAMGTVRTTMIHMEDARPLSFFQSCSSLHSLPPSLASVLVFNYLRCLPTSSNVFSIWGQLFTSSGFVPSRKKHGETQNCLYFTGSIFPSPCCQHPSGLSPLADTLCV